MAQVLLSLTWLEPGIDQVMSCLVMRRRRGPEADLHCPNRAQLPRMVPHLIRPPALIHPRHSLMHAIAHRQVLGPRQQTSALLAESALLPIPTPWHV